MIHWRHNNFFQKLVSRVLFILNSFHPNIKFIYDTEVNSIKLAFLDVLLLKESKNFIITLYRKLANSDIYLNWNSFCLQSWKRGTLKALVQRAHLICSAEDLLKTEPYTDGFSWDKLFSTLGYKTNICRRGTEKQTAKHRGQWQ